jgi:hypothetical protein
MFRTIRDLLRLSPLPPEPDFHYEWRVVQITSGGIEPGQELDLYIENGEGGRINIPITRRHVEVMTAYVADPQHGDFWQPEL